MTKTNPQAIYAPFALLRLSTLPSDVVDTPVMLATTKAIEKLLKLEKRWDQVGCQSYRVVADVLNKSPVGKRKAYLALFQALRRGNERKIINICQKNREPLLSIEEVRDLFYITNEILESREFINQLLATEIKSLVQEYSTLVTREDVRWALESEKDILQQLASYLPFTNHMSSKSIKSAITLYKYLTRISLKTSPFRRFMAVAFVDLERDLHPESHLRIRSMRTSGRVSQEWLAFAREEFAKEKMNDDRTLLSVKDNIDYKEMSIARKKKLIMLRGTVWCQYDDKPMRLNEPIPRVLDALRGTHFLRQELVRMLEKAGVAMSIATTLSDTLLDLGFVEVLPGTLVKAPTQVNFVRTFAKTPFGQSHTNMAVVKDKGHSVPEDRKPLSHPTIGKYIQPLHEDVWADIAPVYSPAQIEGIRTTVSRALSSKIMHSVEHRLLLSFFREELTDHAETMRLNEFIESIQLNQAKLRSMMFQNDLISQCRNLPISQDFADIYLHARVQPFTEAGREQLVLNSVYEFPVWQITRYTTGDRVEEARIRSAIRRWLNQSSKRGTRRFIGISHCWECNSLQDHRGVVDFYLKGFVSEPNEVEGVVVSPHDLIVRMSDSKEQLEVVDEKGREIVFLNIGGIIPTPSWGVHFWLPHLTAPLAIKRPEASFDLTQSGSPICHRPRETIYDCVLFRESWYVQAQYLHAEIFGLSKRPIMSDACVMIAAKRICQKLNFPEKFFIQRTIRSDWRSFNSLADKHRKPQWIDINNPLSLKVLEKICNDAHYVLIQEVLPQKRHRLHTKDDLSYVSELHLELMLSW